MGKTYIQNKIYEQMFGLSNEQEHMDRYDKVGRTRDFWRVLDFINLDVTWEMHG